MIVSNEMEKLREVHNFLLNKQAEELTYLHELQESFTTLAKKVIDEQQYLREEMKKFEDKKKMILEQIFSLTQTIKLTSDENLNLKKSMVESSQKAIEEIGSISKMALKESMNSYNPPRSFGLSRKLYHTLANEFSNKTSEHSTYEHATYRVKLQY